MARLTPHAVATLTRDEPIRRTSRNNTAEQRIRRIRREEEWAERTVARQTDILMRGRYGVRL